MERFYISVQVTKEERDEIHSFSRKSGYRDTASMLRDLIEQKKNEVNGNNYE